MTTEGESSIPEGEQAPKPKHPELKLEGRAWVLPSDTTVLQQVRDELERRLVATGWGEPDVSKILTGVDEAITNAIIHGNLSIGSEGAYPSREAYRDAVAAAAKSELAQRKVRVTVEVEPDRVRFGVGDEGAGFDVSKAPDPRESSNLYKEGGRGVFLMKQAFDIVGYNKTGTQVWMEKRRQANS